MADHHKINRNNRARGKNFERKVAKVLGWNRVPYSGGNSAWGPGDVIDGALGVGGHGFWICECKTQTPSGAKPNLSIKDEWITGIVRDAHRASRTPLIAITLVGEPQAFILLPEAAHRLLMDHCEAAPVMMRDARNLALSLHNPHVTWKTPARGKGQGFTIQRRWMKEDLWRVARIIVERKNPGDPTGRTETYTWYMMRLEDFATLYNACNKSRPK